MEAEDVAYTKSKKQREVSVLYTVAIGVKVC